MRTGICKHFGQCGGCSFQDISYSVQMLCKEESIRELMLAYGINCELKPINSYKEWFYRNKMEFSFGRNEGITCGLYKKGSHGELIDVSECLIFSKDAGIVLKAVKDFFTMKGNSVYNKFSHKGFLRNLVMRETKFTNELMLGLVTTSSEELDKDGFTSMLKRLNLNSTLKSVYRIVNDSISDAVIFEKKELLFGEPFIEEKLDEFKFKIAIDSFFQVNPLAIRNLYGKIRDYAKLSKEEKVLDLFCGGGSIGIFLAGMAKFVWGVEVSQAIIDCAWQNAKENNIENISFFTADARAFLNTQGTFYKDIDVLIINPPRPGLSNKIIRAVLRLNPKTIFYSSCNPDTLFANLKELSVAYKPEFIEPFDFFPHTPHLETLVLLRRL
ncbi:MAG: 23S rRNA (uracil(1939)-C(5))-methyltransferase RlmD [Candidatus Omnitrophica bacterium]|jgi:tRNA/tmRNA/rRNA uracil-C5-methylase (TrmA/RlmC/RlmD family)|nr:23S rRNA (uracil(1939)-C(5))-methyltransferase RlmD [Candidatus Omnitrophota bacterium]